MNNLFKSIFTFTMCALIFGACTDNSGNNSAIDNIMSRTSVRTYTSQAVSDDAVETLLRAAMAAPTAVNSQPWKFVVLRNADVLAELADTVPNAGEKLTNSAVTIVVCGDTTKFVEPKPDFWVQDCSAATENLLLAANAIGLGAVWCGVYPDMDRVEAVRKVLNLDDSLIPLNVIPIGYPDGTTQPKDKWKPENIIYLD